MRPTDKNTGKKVNAWVALRARGKPGMLVPGLRGC